MIPLLLDPACVAVGLVGRGDLALRRLDWLRAAGADPMVWSDAPSRALKAAAGECLVLRLPKPAEIARLQALWVADLPEDLAGPLAAEARDVRVLVNVEDVLPLCDFHTPAVVRRGRLTVAIGTGGASPAAAGVVRERIAAALPEAWGEALEEIAAARTALKAEGADMAALKADALARLAARGL
jgi:precorrin-2 dehydrogenase / sirohydrochlorin ferrochelatase